jgi:hypothetical protein
MAYLTPEQAADLAGISLGYLNHLRTKISIDSGRTGPPYFIVKSDPLVTGFANPVRIRYDEKDIIEWAAERKARKAAKPKITRFAS